MDKGSLQNILANADDLANRLEDHEPNRPLAHSRPDHETGLDTIDPSTHPSRSAEHFRRIIAAEKNVQAAMAALDAAVVAAREAGDSWSLIGAALGISATTAQQRFGC